MNRLTISEAVANGIKLLDEHGPDDWRERVDIDTLAFPDTQNCVFGQVFGDYSDGVDELCPHMPRRGTSVGLVDLGLISHQPEWGYSELTVEWKRQLQALREEHS